MISNGGAVEVDFGDVLVNQMDHVLQGIITDPNLNGWYDSAGQEGPDKCEAMGGAAPGSDASAWFIEAGTTPTVLSLPYGVQSDLHFYDIYNTLFSSGDKFYLQSSWDAAQNDPGLGGQQQGQCVPYVQLTPNFPAPAKVDPQPAHRL